MGVKLMKSHLKKKRAGRKSQVTFSARVVSLNRIRLILANQLNFQQVSPTLRWLMPDVVLELEGLEVMWISRHSHH